MSNTNTTFPPLNTNTPLVFLTPSAGYELEVSRYVFVATLGAYIWDLLTNLNNDCKLLTKHRVRLPTWIYFLSRLSSLAFIATNTVAQIATVPSCQSVQIAAGLCFMIAIPSTSLLLFLRLRAVFVGDRMVNMFYAILWLTTVGGGIAVPLAIKGGHIGPTNYCINTAVKQYSSVGFITPTVYDTFVVIAISWRLITATAVDGSFRGRLKCFFGGQGLPALSKALLQGGQQYYFFTVGFNILTVAMVLSPSISPVFRAMFAIPNVAVTNAMACLVFRKIRFGLIPPTHVSQSTPVHGALLPLQRLKHQRGQSATASPGIPHHPDGVQITRTVEHTVDAMPMQVMFPNGTKEFESDIKSQDSA